MSGWYDYILNSQGSVRCEGMANYKTNYTVFATHDDLGVMFIRTVWLDVDGRGIETWLSVT